MVKFNVSSDRRFKHELKLFLEKFKPDYKYVQLDDGKYILEPRFNNNIYYI